MSIDVFEGVKRTKLVAQALILGASIVIALNMPKLPLSLMFETSGPVDGWRLADRPCDAPSYLLSGEEVDIGYSEKVRAELCFRAVKLADGRILIPYQIDGLIASGGYDYSVNTMVYEWDRQSTFTITESVKSAALSRAGREALKKKLHNIERVGPYALYGCGLFEILFWCVVWIMSGFLRLKHP